jgi:hypothetical protein
LNKANVPTSRCLALLLRRETKVDLVVLMSQPVKRMTARMVSPVVVDWVAIVV